VKAQNMRTLRAMPVRELTPGQCGMLLVHSHRCSIERRRALLYRASEAPAMFFPLLAQRQAIEAFIVQEALIWWREQEKQGGVA